MAGSTKGGDDYAVTTQTPTTTVTAGGFNVPGFFDRKSNADKTRDALLIAGAGVFMVAVLMILKKH